MPAVTLGHTTRPQERRPRVRELGVEVIVALAKVSMIPWEYGWGGLSDKETTIVGLGVGENNAAIAEIDIIDVVQSQLSVHWYARRLHTA